MKIKRKNLREWEYKNGADYFTVAIDDDLEHWLNKKYHPELKKDVSITHLENLPIEIILARLINKNPSRDYVFHSDDLMNFNLAIQRLNNS